MNYDTLKVVFLSLNTVHKLNYIDFYKNVSCSGMYMYEWNGLHGGQEEDFYVICNCCDVKDVWMVKMSKSCVSAW